MQDKVSEKAIWEGSIPSENENNQFGSFPQPQPQMMFCYKCNNVIPGDSKYCPYCQVELFTTCPKCGAKYSSQYPSCSRCGTNRQEYLRLQKIEHNNRTESKNENVFAERGVYNGHEYVDLGLSVKWATCNLGADEPHLFGNHYAWGETMPKTNYFSENYSKSVYNGSILSLYDDAAHVNWEGRWRIPTRAEWEELRNKCTWEWTNRNGINGMLIQSKMNTNSIFLPAAGFSHKSENNYRRGNYGAYWSSSLNVAEGRFAKSCNFRKKLFNIDIEACGNGIRSYGLSIRPVCS